MNFDIFVEKRQCFSANPQGVAPIHVAEACLLLRKMPQVLNEWHFQQVGLIVTQLRDFDFCADSCRVYRCTGMG